MHKSILSKPTVYESFVRTWSTSPSKAIPASSSAVTKSVTSAFSSSVASTRLSRQIVGTSSTSSLFKDQKTSLFGFDKRQVRGMASTQPLTQSTMPTAQELKLQTSTSEIKTAPGVSLNDHQQVIVASVLDLFAGHPSLRNLTLWTDTAIFNDPITLAEGRKQFSAQWYGLPAAFSSIQRLSHEVTSAGNPITMNLSTMYKVKGVGSEKEIDSVVDIFIDEKTGKIGKVMDKWDGSIEGGGVKHAFRKLNSVSVPAMVKVPKSIEEEESKK